MRKAFLTLTILTVMALTADLFTLSSAQPPAPDDTPTFYRPTHGVYVNGWPRFTVTYPKDWVEEKPSALEIFRVASPDPAFEEKFMIQVFPSPLPLDKSADNLVIFWRNIAKDVAVVADNPFRLTDGTPAREVELKMVMNGLPFSFFRLATKKGDMWVTTGMGSRRGKIGEDLKAFPRSLVFEPGKDEPGKVPPDVREFLDRWCSAWVAHDLAKVMTCYSDKYLNSGMRKDELERFHRQVIGSTMSLEVGITDLVATGEMAYLAGFVITTPGKMQLGVGSIIKENGEWKFYGNQRDVAR